jgi:hypothetical protein
MTDRYAIVPFNGPPPLEAIVIGDLDAVLRYLPQTVAAEELEQRALGLADRLTVREQAFSDGVRVLTQSVGKFMDACGRLVDGEEERAAEQVRLDEEEKARAEQAEIEAYLAQNPEPGGALSDDTHQPSGELHALDPPDREHLGGGVEEDEQGDLPNELKKGAPSPIGSMFEPDPEDLGGPPDPRQVSQPVSASFW